MWSRMLQVTPQNSIKRVKALAKREAAVAAGWTRQTTQTNDISAAIQKLTVLKVTVTAQVKFC